VKRIDRCADPFEHRRVDRVHFVGAGQADIGDLVGDGDRYAVVHSSLHVPLGDGYQTIRLPVSPQY
jgi:hypothetical protein